MKMIIAIVKDDDVENIINALTTNQYRFTRVASTGGFFKKGSTTLLSGIEDNQVDALIDLLKKNSTADQSGKRGLTIFVMPVDRFEQV